VPAGERYTLPMRRTRTLAVLLLLLALLSIGTLAACAPGNLGSEEIAFLRDGNLWTISPNGSNPFEVEDQNTPILGYALSPNHEMFVFRELDSAFAKTTAGKLLAINPITGLAGDVPSTLNTVGIDGGSPIPIIPSSPTLAHSDAWWTPDSTYVLYREATYPTLPPPDLVTWVVSQNDQPAGIARKFLPNSSSIPSVSPSSRMAIGNSYRGIFTTTITGTNQTFLVHGALTGHPLPASLERILWQPAHQQPALLYALLANTQPGKQVAFNLILRAANGQTRVLAECACRQFAWSPDGNHILYSTDQGYTILNIQNNTQVHFQAEHEAIPYWSPDSRSLLLDGLHTLTLVHVVNGQTQIILSDGHAPLMADGPLPGFAALLQPLGNSPWNADSQRFVLVTRGRTLWQGQQLHSGNGLYLVTLNKQDAPQGTPTLVDGNGHDTQPGWSYENPNTSFLF